jgi:hypothetical protein
MGRFSVKLYCIVKLCTFDQEKNCLTAIISFQYLDLKTVGRIGKTCMKYVSELNKTANLESAAPSPFLSLSQKLQKDGMYLAFHWESVKL